MRVSGSGSGAVHPHARGELRCSSSNLMTYLGSSPRTWGTQGLYRVTITKYGSSPRTWGTPTIFTSLPSHDGSSPRTWELRGEPLDIFREAGFIPTHVELRYVARAYDTHYGSSPRTWGTQGRSSWSGLPDRFIPTHVGNSAGILLCSGIIPVHPHARGELPHSTML